MAANDQTYRNQKALDIVFAVSCVLMLLSVVLMFWQDYNREFKKVQREFRDVDEALTERTMIKKLPNQPGNVQELSEKVITARKNIANIKEANRAQHSQLYASKAKAEAASQSLKADLDSTTSLLHIAIDNRDEAPPDRRPEMQKIVEEWEKKVANLRMEYDKAEVDRQAVDTELKKLQENERVAQKELDDAEANLKSYSGDFDRMAKLAAQKRWKMGDFFRNLPVLDAFASPTRIQQITLSEYPIDYSFKYVTRYDRCTTCHMGIDRPAYERNLLRELDPSSERDEVKRKQLEKQMAEEQEKLAEARDLLIQREKNGESLGFDPSDLPKKLRDVKLTPGQITEYCAHPRLDLFVDANSPHPMEKFGCTSCHGGQGSATDFFLADHMPNSSGQADEWKKEYSWKRDHFWDYPMLAGRFIESTCLKCHHQVTDLIRFGNKQEAPKLMRGYFLVRENGCFGCHEIAGMKNGKEIGPDLRLEPIPPLDAFPAAERARLAADLQNPVGTMRKVGPSLYRLSEKVDQAWVRSWIRAPRDFRPNTKMPHFYGLSNNSPETLPDDQKPFPAVEMYSAAYYLIRESQEYLAGKDRFTGTDEARRKELEGARDKQTASEKDLRELEELVRRMDVQKKPVPLLRQLKDSEGRAVALPPDTEGAARAEQVTRGHKLFSERGCLACHSHQGSMKAETDVPAVKGEAIFGPDLSRLAAKINPENGDKDAKRRWLVQWIMDPHVHSPRSRMPVTFLDVNQAADVAAWLLAQPNDWKLDDVPAPTLTALANLTRVHLLKAPGMTRQDVEDALTPVGNNTLRGIANVSSLAKDADEIELAAPIDDNKLKWYIGRKTISRLGCYACHDIPGFNGSKPVGTPLNDWGKKDPERLAFEDIDAFMEEHYKPVDSLSGKESAEVIAEGKKKPYEKFFLEALEHHTREGFLNQKLVEPRSYDHGRLRPWEDRARMPQFRFARGDAIPVEGETQEQADLRAEAEAREAVMTFILGLVAEPVPSAYLNQPQPDRLAEAKGRTVLEKYNCGGCHQVRPGVYEFKRTTDALKELVDKSYQKKPAKSDYHDEFINQNEWTGRAPLLPDRLIGLGVPDAASPELIRLSEALRVTVKKEEEVRDELAKGTYDVPASTYIGVPPADLVHLGDPFGGTFSELMVGYLRSRSPSAYTNYQSARAALPPPLFREGEKVQPSWLFQFLRNPTQVRRATILRMPRFNMSDEEAMALVNYFAAIDHQNNPGEGLDYPYMALPQRNSEFWTEKSIAYSERLKKDKALFDKRLAQLQPLLARFLEDDIKKQSTKVEEAKTALAAAKEPAAKKTATDELAKEQAALTQLQNQAQTKKGSFFDERIGKFEAKDAYAFDAYRMLVSSSTPCLGCHQVGQFQGKNPPHEQGPPLDLTWERLRPGWALRWIANPDRLLSYPTPMPQNFPRDKVDDKGYGNLYPLDFVGTPLEQTTGIRDILMVLPQIADMPENRSHRPDQKEEKK